MILEEIYKLKMMEIKIFFKEKCEKEKSEIEVNFD